MTNRWVLGARPRTLPAAVVPVLVGSAASVGLANHFGGTVAGIATVEHDALVVSTGGRLMIMVLAMVVALALQVGTNYANDYSDGKRGTDDPGERVGPPRLVGNGLATPGEVKRAMLVAFGVALVAGAALVGIMFALEAPSAWVLLPVGAASVAAGWFYTGGPRPYGYAGFGELFVFTFFGMVATIGSTYVQVGRVTWLSVGCGVVCGCWATAMLVTNNLRDIPGDTRAGKRTLAVRLGDRRTRILYAVLVTLPFVVLPVLAGLGGRPAGALAFAAIVVATKPLTQVLGGASGPALIPVLGATGRAQLLYGLLLAGGLLIVT